jgi:dihydrofolate reductase
MRKIIVLEFVTLDGIMQAPGGPQEDTSGGFKYGGWTVPFADPTSGKLMSKQMAGKYDLLLGRKTYDIFASYWPHHGDIWPQDNKITKYVVSHKDLEPTWDKTVVLRNAADIKKIRRGSGPPLQVYGSGDLIQTLLKEDLIDELWLKIYPVVLGKGKKLFAGGAIPANFKLTESKPTPKGIIFANYKRFGKVKTGSFA